MAASFLQSVSITTSAGVTSVGVAWTTQNCTPGSLMTAAVFMNNDANTLTFTGVADPTNGAWTPVGSMLTGASSISGYSSQIYYLSGNVSSAKPTVTLSISASCTFCGIAIHEYSGVKALESSAYLDQNSSAPAQTLTPLNSSDMLFGYIIPGTSATAVASPFTFRESANWADNGTGDDTSPTGGTAATATWTISSPPTDTMMGLAVFSATAPAPSPPSVQAHFIGI